MRRDARRPPLVMAVNVLLRLSARGEALIAELLRVSDHVPAFFALGDKT